MHPDIVWIQIFCPRIASGVGLKQLTVLRSRDGLSSFLSLLLFERASRNPHNARQTGLLPFIPAMGENVNEVMPQTSRTFEPPFTDVPGALAEIRAGRMVVVVDDEDRENEGDLTLAAEHVTPEAINFMARYGRGLICLTLTEERADYLRLFPMTQQNSSRFGTAFTETIEAREGVTTGISAADRAHTIRTAIDPEVDLCRSGPARPRLSPARAQGRRAGARRADRSFSRSGAAGRAQSRGRDLRDHARRRRDGAHSRPDPVLPGAWAAGFSPSPS